MRGVGVDGCYNTCLVYMRFWVQSLASSHTHTKKNFLSEEIKLLKLFLLEESI